MHNLASNTASNMSLHGHDNGILVKDFNIL